MCKSEGVRSSGGDRFHPVQLFGYNWSVAVRDRLSIAQFTERIVAPSPKTAGGGGGW
jgi:hypothetical protein